MVAGSIGLEPLVGIEEPRIGAFWLLDNYYASTSDLKGCVQEIST